MSTGAIISILLAALIVYGVAYYLARQSWGPQSMLRYAVPVGVIALFLIFAFGGGWVWLVGNASDEPLLPLAVWVDGLVNWLVEEYGDSLRRNISNPIVYTIGFFERFLHEDVAWPIMALLFAGVTFHASRNLWLTLFVAAAFALIWALQLWKPTMQTLSLISVSILITVLIGMPAGIAMGLSNRFRAFMMPILDFMQTMPSFVYLIPVVMLFGLGTFSGVLATAIYAAPPLVRLTDLGIRLVDKEVMEAATAFGASDRQKLWKVQLPLALPNIMAGVNQSIMMALAMVVIASMIGVRGLGQEVLFGLQRQDAGAGFTAGLSIVFLAIVLDRITQSYGRRLQAHYRTGGH